MALQQLATPRAVQAWGEMGLRSLAEALLEVARDDGAHGPRRRVVEFCQTRWDVPVVVLAAYLAMVWLAAVHPLPKERVGRPSVERAFAAWNLALSLFSCWGAWHLGLWLREAVESRGFFFTVCNDPLAFATRQSSHATLALFLFSFSKVPELGDTAFLILKGKPVRFLQWYHHSTVMLFCWLAIATEYTPGLWFAATNYVVHGIMYTYFFLMAFPPLRTVVKAMGPLVTVIQIAQMVFGLCVNGFAVSYYLAGNYCHIQDVAVYAAIGMYASYFVLFSRLFVRSRQAKVAGEARSQPQLLASESARSLGK